MDEPRDIVERVRRLEEAQAFAERTAEDLGEELRALGRRVSELHAAVRRLEGRVERLTPPPEEPSPEDAPSQDQ